MPSRTEKGGRQLRRSRVSLASTTSESTNRPISARLPVSAPPRRRSPTGTPSRRAERPADFRDELWRAQFFAIGREQRAPGSSRSARGGDDQIGEVADVDQAATIPDRAQRKRQAPIDQANEPQEVRAHAGAVDERRPHEDDLHLSAQARQRALGIPLRAGIAILWLRRITCVEWPV